MPHQHHRHRIHRFRHLLHKSVVGPLAALADLHIQQRSEEEAIVLLKRAYTVDKEALGTTREKGWAGADCSRLADGITPGSSCMWYSYSIHPSFSPEQHSYI